MRERRLKPRMMNGYLKNEEVITKRWPRRSIAPRLAKFLRQRGAIGRSPIGRAKPCDADKQQILLFRA
jgi:hypothetical protein